MNDLPISEEVSAWMGELTYDDGVHPDATGPRISTTQRKFTFKVCDQETSASLSILGYAIWKACGISEVASNIHSKMMSIPCENGFAPSRWKQCLEVIMEK